jgi:hypothetical protein
MGHAITTFLSSSFKQVELGALVFFDPRTGTRAIKPSSTLMRGGRILLSGSKSRATVKLIAYMAYDP